MVAGNAEEGLNRDIKDPAHSRWSRPAFYLATAVWFGGWIVFSSWPTGLPIVVEVLVVVLLGSIAGGLLAKWGSRWQAKRRAREAEDARAIREAETEKQLDEARAAGLIRPGSEP
ncbi:MAG: hypothetical protein AAGC81_17820 [Pseudomonadota bacterium]